MIEYRFGNMMDMWGKTPLFCFTANATVIGNELIMGGGIALQVKRKAPELGQLLAGAISFFEYPRLYGLAVAPASDGQQVGAFQVKTRVDLNAIPRVVAYAAACLRQHVEMHELKELDLNYPAIGLGGLKAEDVEPYFFSVLHTASATVRIWRHEDGR